VQDEVRLPVTDASENIHLAPIPPEAMDQAWLDSLPEKTRMEMQAGRRALMSSEDALKEMNEITKSLAEEMFSSRAAEILTKRRIKLDSRTKWKIEAVANQEASRWDVKVTITHEGNPPTTLVEPYAQFPSEEMIAYLMCMG
jgi:hypothetical protein